MHLKLGIMLMREDKFHYDKQEEPNRKGRISSDEAIHEAIHLYKKCPQGVAYSQYQLGCALRDRLLFEFVKSDVTRLQGDIDKLIESWLEAERYYLDVGDTDKFLRIRVDHSDLYSAIRRKTGTNKVLDQALIQLLRGCAVVFNGSSVSEEFIQKLLLLLKTMCQTAKNLPRDIASSSSPSMADDYKFLAEIYRCALNLNLKGTKDYRLLYIKWKSYDSSTS